MTKTALHLIAALLLPACLAIALPARATPSHDGCTGFIDSVPTTITAQGTWCLRRHLSTSISSGAAISIIANNVSIDCRGFKLGGLAAGYASFAYGIHAMGQQNISVRNCQLRGFYSGIALHSSHGSLVEDNRLDNNLAVGISLVGENNLVRRNRIYDTGGAAGRRWAYGIDAQADIIDNTVSGLFADAAGGDLIGIRAGGFGTQVRGNAVSRLESAARDGTVEGGFGIVLVDSQIRASDNHLAGARDRAIQGTGLLSESSQNYCANNSVGGFTTRISGSGACTSSNNLLRP